MIRKAVGRAFSLLLDPEGRRGWALMLLAGAGITMTAYAAVVLYYVKENAAYALYLGLAAHVIIFVVITGFAGLLVKRSVSAEVFGNKFSSTDLVEAAAQAGAVAGAVAGAAASTATTPAPGTTTTTTIKTEIPDAGNQG